MKKIIITVSLFSLVIASCVKKVSQSKAMDSKDQALMLKRDFSSDIINQLKASTTVFFYIKDKGLQLDSLKQVVKTGWDLTPVVFDNIDNIDKYASDRKYSYFVIEKLTSTGSKSGVTSIHYYLTVRLFKGVTKKGLVLTDGLCRIELYPNSKTLVGSPFKRKDDGIHGLYEKGVFYNWSPILLRAQLGAVSTNLKKNVRPWLFENIHNDKLGGLLSKDTLYVPQSLLMEFNSFSLKEKSKETNFFSSYKYKYKVCTDSELYNIFEVQKRGRLLFEYVKSSTDKFITIYDLQEKSIVYKQYTPISYNLKTKDIDKIY